MQLSRRTRLLLAFLCFFCFFGAVFCSARFLTTVSNADAMRMLDVASRNLLVSLLDAETGQRGFIITADERYLEPYYAGVTSVPNRLNELKQAGAGTPEVEVIDEVQELTKEKVDELAETVRLRLKSFDAARSEIDSHVGKNYMDEIRKRIDTIQLWASERYVKLSDVATVYARISFVMMLISVVSGCYLTIIRRD